MELKTLELEPDIQIRVVIETKKKIWFLVSDLCKVLKTKTKPTRFIFDDENDKRKIKVKIGKQVRECLFVNQSGANSIICHSRGPESTRMRDLRYQIFKGRKKFKLIS